MEVPAEVVAAIGGTPEPGPLDQAFSLLTVDRSGVVDVCLLSRTELQADADAVRLVVASSKARRNLAASGKATLVAVAGDAAHYLALRVLREVEAEGAAAFELGVDRALRDDLGVELRPILFRVDPRLRVEERWDRTEALLALLARTGT